MLAGVNELTLHLGERDATFEAGPVRLTTMLIEGDFPNYKGLIPSAHPNRLTVSREALLEGVRRVKLLAREATPVRLAMSNDGLDLVAVTQDVGQAHESLDAKYEGAELTVAFNPDYLLQGIEVLPGDEVLLETVDSLKPALVKSPEHPEFLYLLMPVRVSCGPSGGGAGVQVRTLWLTDFRSYTSAQLDLGPGLTALVGANGEGKTNLLEALAWLATLSSFRGGAHRRPRPPGGAVRGRAGPRRA